MTTNHGPPWGAVRVHCTRAARGSEGTLYRGPRYNAGALVLIAPTVKENNTHSLLLADPTDTADMADMAGSCRDLLPLPP